MKYARTKHLSFSPEIHSDDKAMSKEEESSLLNRYLYFSEKLDGGNTRLHKSCVGARSASLNADHGSFSRIKKLYRDLYYSNEFDFDRYILYGENMQGIHSIEYDALKHPFYLFAALDTETNQIVSVQELEAISLETTFPLAPSLGIHKFSKMKDLKKFIEEQQKLPSLIGGEREGVVLRIVEEFPVEEFEKHVVKYVRKGHVQCDSHWSTDWKEAKFI